MMMNTLNLTDNDVAHIVHVLIDYRDELMRNHTESCMHIASGTDLEAIKRSQSIIDQLGEL